MLKLHPCLTEQERAETLEAIYGLKEHWNERMGSGLPFYTLGTASYLDAAQEGEIYYKIQAKRTNEILSSHFSALYRKVAETLQKATGKEVVYEDRYALPGFHIFQFSEYFTFPIASTHFDLQFQELYWPYRNIDYNSPISFTLAVKLPAGGGGLNYWDICYPDVKDLSQNEMEKLRESREKYYLPYEEGKMAVHGGLTLHQIAPAQKMKPGDERITLQGHGLVCENILRVYW